MELLSDEECLRQADMPGIVVIFSVPNGPAWRRQWTWREFWSGVVPKWVYSHNGPWWLDHPEVDAPEDPLLPIEFRGHVSKENLWLAREQLWPDVD